VYVIEESLILLVSYNLLICIMVNALQHISSNDCCVWQCFEKCDANYVAGKENVKTVPITGLAI
jgi:hypothetical protein